MKKVAYSLCLLLIVSCANNKSKPNNNPVANDSSAQHSKKDTLAPQIDSATMMKSMMTYMTPGKFHQMLNGYNGKWKAAMTVWAAPDASPRKSTTAGDLKMVLGGRFQEGKFNGTFMGMPFESINLLGFDNSKTSLYVV